MLLRRIIRHELRDVLRDGRFRWVSAIVLTLLVMTLLTGAAYQRAVSADHASAAQMSRDSWLAQPAKDPHTAAHYGAYAFKPRGPLTLFDTGVNEYAGVAAFLEAHKQNEFQFRPAQDRSSIARLGQLTAATALQFLVPVLIVLLAFTKFAGERQDGTLRQLVAAGMSPRTLAIGKALGVGGALAIVLVPACAVGSVALVWTSGSTALDHQTSRVAALTIVYLAYFAMMTTLALAVSAVIRSPSHVMALLVAFWASNALLAPRLASDLSRRLHPVPTAFDFAEAVEQEVYDGLPVHAYNVKRAADLRSRLFRQYNVSRVEDLPVNFRGVDYLEREARANEIWDRHYREVWSAFAQQTHTHQVTAIAAPLMAVRALSMALTGTDWHHHQDFAMAAEAYRRRFVLAMNSDLAYGGSSGNRGAYTAQTSLWSSIPTFQYRQPRLRAALEDVRLSIAVLTAWVAVAAAALVFAVRRMHIE
jgi:ABC-2 type transport system permease protein